MSPACDFCSTSTTTYILPPDMIDEPITEGIDKGKRKCHFCKSGKDYLLGTDGEIYKKDDVCMDYKKFCNDVYWKPELYVKFHKSLTDSCANTE